MSQCAELTPAQRAYGIKRRKEIWEIRNPGNQVAQLVPPEIGYKNPPSQEKGFAADTAEATGQSKQDINRHVSRAEARRNLVRDQAAELGIRVELLPSGVYHLRGDGVNMRVRDLADVLRADLVPGRW